VIKQLITKDGKVSLGWLQEPVEEINYLDYSLRSVMDERLPLWRKKMRFNQFQFVGLMCPEIICGIAIVDLKLVSNAFLYVYDFESGKLRQKSLLQPLGYATSIGLRPDSNEALFVQGKNRLQLSTGPGGLTEIDVTIGNEVSIQASIQAEKSFSPLRVCSKAGYDGWVYTQKSAGLRASGTVVWDDLKVELEPGTAFGSSDWTAGYMRKDTFWNWACLAGQDDKGRMVGLNLAAGVNETGVTENGLWVNNKFQKLDLAVFDYDRQAPEKEWSVSTSDGRVQLKFVPQGVRQEKINVFVIASNFKQMFGKFYGTVKCGRELVKVDGVPGFVEDHYARW
jgi:hypothetical protein